MQISSYRWKFTKIACSFIISFFSNILKTKTYQKDYSDFIIDECHRGGDNEEGNWRGILEYFSPAVQLGLTATPKH
jgi:type I restriction enzyme R subunit